MLEILKPVFPAKYYAMREESERIFNDVTSRYPKICSRRLASFLGVGSKSTINYLIQQKRRAYLYKMFLFLLMLDGYEIVKRENSKSREDLILEKMAVGIEN